MASWAPGITSKLRKNPGMYISGGLGLTTAKAMSKSASTESMSMKTIFLGLSVFIGFIRSHKVDLYGFPFNVPSNTVRVLLHQGVDNLIFCNKSAHLIGSFLTASINFKINGFNPKLRFFV